MRAARSSVHPAARGLGLGPRVTLGQHFPVVIVRFVPVHDAPAVRGVDGMVHGPVHAAAVRYAGGADAAEYGVEFRLGDPEAEMDPGQRVAPLVEVECQAVIDVDGYERADAVG